MCEKYSSLKELAEAVARSVKRGDCLIRNTPDLVELVIEGQIPMAQANRQVKEQKIEYR